MGPFPMLRRFRKQPVRAEKQIEVLGHGTFQLQQLLVRQAKQEKEKKSRGDRLTLIERFNMLELTADLKRLCPSVKREYSTYQPMTDVIYTKWERTRSLSVVELQQNLPLLDINANQSKAKVAVRTVSSANSCPAEIEKMPINTVYTISPLLLRKDIAAIVTDNIPAGSDSILTKNADKLSTSTTTPIRKDSENRKKRFVRKEADIRKVRNRERCPDLMAEEGSQSPTSSSCSRVSTPGTRTTNLDIYKKKAWSRNETDMKDSKSAKELLIRKVNFSIFHPTFDQASKKESVSKSIFWNIIPGDTDPFDFSFKEFIDIHGNRIPGINLWHCP